METPVACLSYVVSSGQPGLHCETLGQNRKEMKEQRQLPTPTGLMVGSGGLFNELLGYTLGAIIKVVCMAGRLHWGWGRSGMPLKDFPT